MEIINTTKWTCTTCKREFLNNKELPIDKDMTCEYCFAQAEAWHSQWASHMQMKHGDNGEEPHDTHNM